MIKRGPLPKTNFTVASNELVRDSQLSYEARGLLLELLSRPENWIVSPSALAKGSPAGLGKITRMLKELTDSGYIARLVSRDAKGRMAKFDFEVYDKPTLAGKKPDEKIEPLVDYPLVDNPLVDKPIVDKPIVDNPLVAEPLVENPVLRSKDSKKNRDNKVTSKETSKETRKRSPTPKMNFDSWPNQPEPQILNDWLLVRKGKRSALTQTAINRIAKQLWLANQAGYSVDDCIGLCCERSWAAYKFEWHQNHLQQAGQTNGSPKKPNSLQTAHRDINEEFYRAQAEIAAADPVEADDPAVRSQVDYSLPDVRQRARKS